MFVIPFLSPFYQTCVAFTNTHYSISEKIEENQESKNKRERESEIKEIMQPFLDKNGIRKDLIFREKSQEKKTTDFHYCLAKGTNYFTSGNAVIRWGKDLYSIDKYACLIAMKHEICHIKKNYYFKIPAVGAIIGIVTGIFCFQLPVIASLAVVFIVQMVAMYRFNNYCERIADDFILLESTPEELKGGRRYLKSLQQASIEIKNAGFPYNLLLTPAGCYLCGSYYPSMERIYKIELALQKRNIVINQEEEEAKIKILTDLAVNKFKKNLEKTES